MNVSFGAKLAIAIATLAVGATSTGVLIFYFNTDALTRKMLTAHVRDVTHTGSYLFHDKERKLINKLRSQLLRDSKNLRKEVMKKLAPNTGDFKPALKPEVINRYLASPEIKYLQKRLFEFWSASSKNIFPLKQITTEWDGVENNAQVAFTYLFIKIPEAPNAEYLMTVVDTYMKWIDFNNNGKMDTEGKDSEVPNPTGNLYSTNKTFWAKVIKTKKVELSDGWYTDAFGTFISAAAPILDEKGEVIALLGVDYKVGSHIAQLDRLKYVCIAIISISFILSIIVAYGLARILNRPIVKLREGAERVANRDFDTQIEVTSKDELGLLAETFNSMVHDIREYSAGLESLNQALNRFVPEQFLALLGKTTIIEVSLGDQVQREMAILFSDIRSFTSLSETMTPEENFNFLNEYLRRMEPLIHKRDGVIDKYIGDAIMALFPLNPEDALKSSIDMQLALVEYNKERQEMYPGSMIIKVGMGMHTGSLMLGTIGGENRMEGTVISDTVNLAARLEGLTKFYGANIIISEAMFMSLSDPTAYNYRFLDKIQVKGKSTAVSVFEILDGSSEEVIDLKIKTRQDFERGLDLYHQQNFHMAILQFRRVLDINPDDKAAEVYLRRAEYYEKHGVPEFWEGIEALDFK